MAIQVHSQCMMVKAPANLGMNQAGSPVTFVGSEFPAGLLSFRGYKTLGYNFTTGGTVARYMDPIPVEARSTEALTRAVYEKYCAVVRGEERVMVEGKETTLAAGPWGDTVQVSYVVLERGNVVGNITQIAENQYILIAEAVDNAIIVQDSSGETYFVGGIRANDPKRGFPAFCGGFKDVKEDQRTGCNRAASTMRTAVTEGRQETRFQFKPSEEDQERVDDYNTKELRGTVSHIQKKVAGEEFPVHMRYIGTIETGNAPIAQGGEVLDGAKKRVLTTDLVISTIQTTGKNSVEQVRSMFHSDNDESDLTGIVVVPLKGMFEESSTPEKVEKAAALALKEATACNAAQLQGKGFEWGILHHNDLFKMVITQLNKDYQASQNQDLQASQGWFDFVAGKVSDFFVGIKEWIFSWCTCFAKKDLKEQAKV